jgi:hypothetical protein
MTHLLGDGYGKTPIRTPEPMLRWREVVGEQIARQAQPESLKNGVLLVRVENSIWLSHLRFLAEDLREKLNRELSSPGVEEIHFRQGQLDPDIVLTPPVKSRRPGRPRARKSCPPLTPEQHGLLAGVADEQVRQALENLLRKQAGSGRPGRR